MLLGGGVLVVIWALTLLGDPQGNELLQRLVGLAYPLGDLVMAAVVVSAVGRRSHNRATMHLVLAGVVALAVADTWFAVVVTIGDFGLPYWLDTGWVLGYFLIALGALWAPHDVAWAEVRAPVAALRTSGAKYGGGIAQGALLTAAPGTRVMSRDRSVQHWLATANTDHIVNYTAIMLIVVDASVVLYDLGSILKMLG